MKSQPGLRSSPHPRHSKEATPLLCLPQDRALPILRSKGIFSRYLPGQHKHPFGQQSQRAREDQRLRAGVSAPEKYPAEHEDVAMYFLKGFSSVKDFRY